MNRIIIDGLAFALPLFIIALGGIYSEKSGITNLALEGLQGMGAFFGAFFVVLTSRWLGNSSLSFYLAFLVAALGGAFYALLHALLCIHFKANQVISGVVVNIMAVALSSFLTVQLNSSFFNQASNSFNLSALQRITIPVLSSIPVLGGFFSDIYPFQFLIIGVALIAWWNLYRSSYGLHLRACGDNPHAVDAAGISVAGIRFSAVLISGALAGMGGICFAYSLSTNFSSTIFSGYGFLAIAAMIFGNWKMLPTLGACILFGISRSGGDQIVQILKMPSSFKYLAVALPYLLTLLLLIFFSASNKAPKSLGEIYDKGKR